MQLLRILLIHFKNCLQKMDHPFHNHLLCCQYLWTRSDLNYFSSYTYNHLSCCNGTCYIRTAKRQNAALSKYISNNNLHCYNYFYHLFLEFDKHSNPIYNKLYTVFSTKQRSLLADSIYNCIYDWHDYKQKENALKKEANYGFFFYAK